MKSERMLTILLLALGLAVWPVGVIEAKAESGAIKPASAAEAGALQKQAAKELGLPVQKTVDLKRGAKMEFMLIPAGQFRMGSPGSEHKRGSDEGPRHLVKISKPFYMGKFEVTQEQYEAVTGKALKFKFWGDKLPVEQIDWDQCNAFLKTLSDELDLTLRLPTEAEWEYACRGGTSTAFNIGDTINSDQANYNCKRLYGYGIKGPYKERTVNVGSYPANAFGLHDMHGNVWEWCSDRYKGGYYKESPEDDPKGPFDGMMRVIRGGSWNSHPAKLRSADRDRRMPSSDRKNIGFRAVLEVK